MLKQQQTMGNQAYHRFHLWKQMALITAMLISGGSLATLVPSQAAYAHSKPNTHHTSHKGRSTHTKSIKMLIVCQAGNGGQGGSATNKSSGATGGAGGSCNITIPINVFVTIQNNTYQKTSTSSSGANEDGDQKSNN